MFKKLSIFSIIALISILTVFGYYQLPYRYDAKQAVAYLTTHSERRSKGLCAQYVRKAMEAGGCNTWGHPLTAHGYDEFLVDLDFTKIAREGYRRKAGDIVVFKATQKHPYGHIAMWNGQQWISDFRQSGLYVAADYRKAQNFQYYRMVKERPRRKFKPWHQLMWLGEQVVGLVTKVAQKTADMTAVKIADDN